MGQGLDRTEILRRDCGNCHGHGYTNPTGTVENMCESCAGSGQEEIEVPFKFDGSRSKEELDEIWRNKK